MEQKQLTVKEAIEQGYERGVYYLKFTCDWFALIYNGCFGDPFLLNPKQTAVGNISDTNLSLPLTSKFPPI